LSDVETEPASGDRSSSDGDTTPNASNVNLPDTDLVKSPETLEDTTDAQLELPQLLQRDQLRKTAYYDYATDKQTSQEEAKQFYQRHQLETLSSSGSVDGQSPLLHARSGSVPPLPEAEGLGRSESMRTMASHKSRLALDQPIPFRTAAQNETLMQADTIARDHAKHPGLPHEVKPPLLETAGIHGAGAGVGVGSGAGGFAYSDASVTAELSAIYSNIQKILDLRHRYMQQSLQCSFDNPKDDPEWSIYPAHPEPAWKHDAAAAGQSSLANSTILETGTPSKESYKRSRKPGQDIGEDFEIDDLLPLPGRDHQKYRLDEYGVYQVYENSRSLEQDMPVVNVPTLRDFYMDLEQILNVSSDGPSKSFAFRRLQYLEGKFNLYILLNEYQEMADTKRVPHRDFYNVRKVDTHVHHSACMNQKHLLRFIKSKMKKSPDETVLYRDGKYLTLKEVFESINLTAYDLSIDTLDMHVS
jgi:AMP deaminase